MSNRRGRHFLQIPGPSNVPDRILRAMDRPTIDHRGPEFAQLGLSVLSGMQKIFKTENPVVIYPGSGTGAWEAALVNTLSAGDQVLMYETGQFATLWHGLTKKLGLNAEFISGDWRHGVDATAVKVETPFSQSGALSESQGRSQGFRTNPTVAPHVFYLCRFRT